jgi:hydrogenase 3 maturation protease
MNTLILCIGNKDGGDDAVGPYIARRLRPFENDTFRVIDCGTTPENYTSVIKTHNPDTLLIIDAVDMGLSPGERRIVPKEMIGSMHVSTHGIPLSVLIQYLREQQVHHIVLIGIQPERMSGGLTASVKKSADQLAEQLSSDTYRAIEQLR